MRSYAVFVNGGIRRIWKKNTYFQKSPYHIIQTFPSISFLFPPLSTLSKHALVTLSKEGSTQKIRQAKATLLSLSKQKICKARDNSPALSLSQQIQHKKEKEKKTKLRQRAGLLQQLLDFAANLRLLATLRSVLSLLVKKKSAIILQQSDKRKQKGAKKKKKTLKERAKNQGKKWKENTTVKMKGAAIEILASSVSSSPILSPPTNSFRFR